MKLWAMPCRATQDGWVMGESSEKMWSIREGNGKPLQYSCPENPMNSMKRQKDRTLKDELPKMLLEKKEWRENETMKKEWTPERMKRWSQSENKTQLWIWLVMEVKSDAGGEQYCIGTWNVRSMNQGKLKVVKQEKARVNTNILGTTELKCTGISKFNSDNHYINIQPTQHSKN